MADFMIHFLICNIFLSVIILLLLVTKRLFKNTLSNRMKYHLWFLLLFMLTIPFIPMHQTGFPQIFLWLANLKNSTFSNTENITENFANPNLINATDWMHDFAVSVSSKSQPVITVIGFILGGIWLVGILVMMICMIKSSAHLRKLKKSALPLQNSDVRRLYDCCLEEMEISKNIPVYSTAFLKSPVIVGILKPCIYLPIHLISDYDENAIRYMLLHELQHYKHKDMIIIYLMNLAGSIYWFNPFIWYALKEMHNDREIACDTSVLNMLDEELYTDYGSTLINFAEKVSLMTFPFAAGIGGKKKQITQRIINIASYKRPTFCKKLKGLLTFMLTTALTLGFIPFISTYAAEDNHYQWKSSSENISYADFSAYFNGYEGSFVLYDLKKDAWSIYNMEQATLRVSPNSTYKIYDALFALEKGVITPEHSLLYWDKEFYPFESWNADQTLQSAMYYSVSWYFQEMDKQLGMDCLNHYLQEIEYGNQTISGDLSAYWLEGSLKISPIEQVALLRKLHDNRFGFDIKNINEVQKSICLSSSETGTLYGKTGTGCIDGQDINGWFIGYVESEHNTYFFATNIKADANANGSHATEITMSILSDMNIWK